MTSFYPPLKIEGFSDLLSEIFTGCDVFNNDPKTRQKSEINEDELRDCVENIFIKIKDIYF